MSFMLTAKNVHLVDGHILKAVLIDEDGGSCEANLDLDDYIGNNEGLLRWDYVGTYLSTIPPSCQQQRLQPTEDG
jgi:hypothetical protein